MTLNEYITKYNIDKSSFAEQIGLSYVNGLYKYLNGTQRPDYDRMKKIEKITGGKVTANDFYR